MTTRSVGQPPRLAAHGATLGARLALVGKVGDDGPGHRLRDTLRRLKVDLRWLATDAGALFGPVENRQAIRLLAELGPRLIYFAETDGSVLLREAGRIQRCPAASPTRPPRDRLAGPAAFWVGLARGLPPQKAVAQSI